MRRSFRYAAKAREGPLTAGYLAAFIVGGLAVLSALVLTDAGHGSLSDGMPFLSLTSLAVALLGAGTGGLAGTAGGLGGWATAGLAVGSAAALLRVLHGTLLPYLRRQPGNSHRGLRHRRDVIWHHCRGTGS